MPHDERDEDEITVRGIFQVHGQHMCIVSMSFHSSLNKTTSRPWARVKMVRQSSRTGTSSVTGSSEETESSCTHALQEAAHRKVAQESLAPSRHLEQCWDSPQGELLAAEVQGLVHVQQEVNNDQLLHDWRPLQSHGSRRVRLENHGIAVVGAKCNWPGHHIKILRVSHMQLDLVIEPGFAFALLLDAVDNVMARLLPPSTSLKGEVQSRNTSLPNRRIPNSLLLIRL